MPLHDRYARVTPFELAFRTRERAESFVAEVEREAEARGVDPGDLNGFLTLAGVDAFVRELAGPEADPGALHRFGPLAFHGLRLAREERPVYLMSTHVARYLVEGVPDGVPEPPGAAGYVQLPQHLFWTRAAGDAPESVDGVFWSVTRGDRFHALAVTGVRPDRPGVGVIPLPTAPLSDAGGWLDADARDGGQAFAVDLPGAELDNLYGLETVGEIFLLLARFFAYTQASPSAVEEGRAPDTDGDGQSADAAADGPVPSSLSYARVVL